MRRSLLFILISLLVVGTVPGPASAAGPADPTPADPTPADSTTFQFAERTMTVHGSSNVRDWTMDVTEMDGSVVVDGEEQGAPTIHTIAVEVPVEALVADRGSMQEKAHKALKKEADPTIRFRSDSVVVATAAADSFAVIAHGDLTIAGQTRAVTVRAKGAARGEGGYHVRGEHELELSTFGVDRPTALFGALRVSDGIRLTFDMVLRRPSS